ncbi:uncharacterized protein EI90DRAFT_3051243 [Cantharellus anzutake]|uniref:uncharacterized protein n=1 Tax=Cantharellus anzutake TaxID=1750568 RepID=UPI0019085CB4|nr:uncharacterized protein EI90DRAFT_3051243 [Cantharellus anzutake]KAF8334148.1 hypothetical protein EI90DRAFT_3051243 [Cantharellus anzutake]
MSDDKRPSVCVFCGSTKGNRPEFADAATALGRALANDNRQLIYGGGTSGLMGRVAAACREAGGRVTGVVPRAIAEGGGEGDSVYNPISPDYPDTLFVGNMHERKMRMAELADGGFVGLPGGFGTFEEVLEAVTWTGLGIHEKPVVLLNVCGYYEPLKLLISKGLEYGFIKQDFASLVVFVEPTEDVVDENFDWGEATLSALNSWKMPEVGGIFKNWDMSQS